MTNTVALKPDSKLDLVLERTVDVPRELIWKAWTTPNLLTKWFTPAPWKTIDCEIDLRPGGIFSTTMQSPEGETFPPSAGCYLEIVPNEKLVWTSALGPGYRPAKRPEGSKECDEFPFTAVLLLEPSENGTKYTAIGMHGDEEACKKHEAMGFEQGWGAVLDQLVTCIKAGDI